MKFTTLFTVLAAVLAVSGFAASTAPALTYNASSSPTNLSGSQSGKHVLKVDGQAVECNTVNLEKNGLVTGSNEINGVVASHSGCTAFGFAGANWNWGTCNWSFKTPNGSPAIMSQVSIACNNNSTANILVINVSIFASECEVHVASQGPLSTASWVNNTPVAGDVSITTEISGIVATKARDTGLCPLSGTGTTNTVTYNGTTSTNAGSNISWKIS